MLRRDVSIIDDMRLTEKEKKAIIDAVRSLRPDAKIYLFGSRIDDSKKGGDIDIFVLDTNPLSIEEKLKIKRLFFNSCGEQKFDLISFAKGDNSTFKRLISQESITLNED